MYSFRQSATQGYLASPESDMRNQRIHEANELGREITQSRAFLQLSKVPELDSIFRELQTQPQELEMPDTSAAGKDDAFAK